ncbi:hypothetical protein NC652_020426 [Populus alba x Populus x berolinensis]|nr:hypothetical protein NC652_020426 [Populus alba x Populus x berolinensis]
MGGDQFVKSNNQGTFFSRYFAYLFYRHVKTKGSPLASIARLVAAAIRRRRVVETVQSQQNYYNGCGNPIEAVGCPTESLGLMQRL